MTQDHKELTKKKRGFLKSLLVLVLGVLGVVYLLNPTAGIIEFIPDNTPIIGNLDEAMAAGFVIAALRYFGIDLTSFFRK